MKSLKSFALLGLAAVSSMGSITAQAADDLTVYSYRQAFLVEPILEQFTKDTGIKVNVVFAKDGIAGAYCP